MIWLLMAVNCLAVSLDTHFQASFDDPVSHQIAFREIPSSKVNPTRQSHIIKKTVASILKNFSKFRGRNCSYVGGFLRRMNVRNVAVYSLNLNSVDCLLLNDLNVQNSLNIDWRIIDETFLASCFGHTRIANVECLVDVDNNIFASSVSATESLRYIMEKYSVGVRYLNYFIEELLVYEKKYCLIERLYVLRKGGIETLVIQMPAVDGVTNPSPWEQVIISNHSVNLFRDGDAYDKYFALSGYDRKYTRDFFHDVYIVFKHIKYKDYDIVGNMKSKAVNVINHVRRTSGTPIDAAHNIHMLGDSTAFGAGVADEDTLASCLQAKVSEIVQARKTLSFSVLNYGVGGTSVEKIQRRLRDVTVKHGDIVLVVGKRFLYNPVIGRVFEKSCEENRVCFYDMQPDFLRPHNYGELFLDYLHTNPKGSVKAAGIIFGILFVNVTKQSTEFDFFHYFCGEMHFLQTPAGIDVAYGKGSDELRCNLDLLSFVRSLETNRDVCLYEGVIVMNCNPFTKGHLFLVEFSSMRVDRNFIFVVEEDKSEFPFIERQNVVRSGTTHLPNVVVIPSSRFVISGFTLPEYFGKTENPNAQIDASMDLEIFCKWIVPSLGTNTRFVGEEPLDKVTLQYNIAMMGTLPKYRIGLEIVPRLEFGGSAISASRVRRLLRTREFDETAKIVPKTTLQYLKKKYS